MNWERTLQDLDVVGDSSPSNAVTWKDIEEEIVFGWLRDGDDKAIRRFYIGKGTQRMSAA